MKENHFLSWEKFLNPDILRQNLILASLYVAYFEILKDIIIDRPKEFYSTGWNLEGMTVGEEYSRKILFRDKSPLYASLSWLLENEVIDSSDLAKFEFVKKCRNELAHELTELIKKGIELRHIDAFSELIYLLNKIEVWWINNVEIPTNPDFSGNDIDESGIIPGNILLLQVLIDVALGDEGRSRFYYQEFTKLIHKDIH